MSGLDTMTNSSRPTSRATMAARQLARGVFSLPVVQPRGPPEAAAGLFRGLRASSRRAKDPDLLRRQQQFTVLSLMTKLAMARHQQALRLQLVVLELLAELQEGPALQVHELVLSVRRALAGVQGLVASEGRVELDEMALELGRRHIVVVLQNPS